MARAEDTKANRHPEVSSREPRNSQNTNRYGRRQHLCVEKHQTPRLQADRPLQFSSLASWLLDPDQSC